MIHHSWHDFVMKITMYQPILHQYKIMFRSGVSKLHILDHICFMQLYLTCFACDIGTFISYRIYSNNNNGSVLGFSASYDTHIEPAPMTFRIGSCGGKIISQRGILTSPSHPDSYPNDAECIYEISLPAMAKINMTFSCFDTFCGDNVEIWDGNSDNSPKMATFCGNGSVIPPFLVTSQNHLRVRYTMLMHYPWSIGMKMMVT